MRDRWAAVQSLVEHLGDGFVPPAPDEAIRFAWHSLPLAEFFLGMEAAQRDLIARNRCWTGRERFLDIGSGIGVKLFLASEMGWQASGIECHAPYAAAGRGLFPAIPVLTADAWDCLAFDAELVYCYRPCVSLDDERLLLHHIVNNCRPGALLFHAGGPDPDWLEPVGGGVWRT